MAQKPWWNISAEAGSDTTEIAIFDRIGASLFFGGISASEMLDELNAIDTPKITVRINSPGGNVFEGIAILNALRAHSATVTTVIEGLAASAASFIAMAGSEIVMRRNAELMIHDAWGDCIGNAADMETMAAQLNRISDNIASIYADRAGGEVADWRAAMKAETWYSDAEAVAAGLADRIDTGAGTDNKARNAFDLSVFAHAGRRAAPRPTFPFAAEVEVTKKEEPMGTLNEALAQRLGIPADADEAAITAALDAALTPAAPVVPTLDQAVAVVAESGMVVAEQSVLDQLTADAAAGREARAQQIADANAVIVDAALAEGRITPADRPKWLALVEKDSDGAAAVLATLAKGSAVPVAEIGHGITAEPESEGDDLYSNLFGKDA